MINQAVPKGVKAFRNFLRFTSSIGSSLKTGIINAPLTSLFKKNAFVWNEETTKAFNHFQEVVTNPPTLALPNFTKIFIIKCDARANGVSSVVIQEKGILEIGLKREEFTTFNI